MPEPTSEAKKSINQTALDYLFGLPAIVVLLVAIIGGGCYGIRWVAIDVVPSHIATFRASIKEVQEANAKLMESQESSHRIERERSEESSRFERTEWRKFHVDAVDRIERMMGMRKARIEIPPRPLDEPAEPVITHRDTP